MLRTLIAVAAGSALAKKAWDHYHQPKARLPEDITNLVGRPEAVEPERKRKPASKSTREDGPSE